MVKLGVNIDHIATVRNARGGMEPEPVTAAAMAALGGADGITAHLREDRRHIRDRDLHALRTTISLPLNLEMACTDEMLFIAGELLPSMCTLVPEKRQELTTEGGLDVIANFENVKKTVHGLMDKGIDVSIFIDPNPDQIEMAAQTGAKFIELHTGRYSDAVRQPDAQHELALLYAEAEHARNLGLNVNAGHGLNYGNILPVAQIDGLNEVNIGHSIISRALFTGLAEAVKEMKALLYQGSLFKS